MVTGNFFNFKIILNLLFGAVIFVIQVIKVPNA